MQRIYIDLGLDPHPARSALTGTLPPQIAGDCLDIRATMAINDASGAGGAVIGGFRAFLALTTKG